jgi:hypothetical protein
MSRRPTLDELEAALGRMADAFRELRDHVERLDLVAHGCTCAAHPVSALATLALQDLRDLEGGMAAAGYEVDLLRLPSLGGLFDDDEYDGEAPT